MSEGFFKNKYLVADAILFLLFWFQKLVQSTETITYSRTYIFCLGLCCGCIVKMTGSLLAEELSSCDCFWVNVSRGIVPFPERRTRTHVSHISRSRSKGLVSQGADSHPLPSTRGKACKNNLNEEITPSSSLGQASDIVKPGQTISNLGHTALVCLRGPSS